MREDLYDHRLKGFVRDTKITNRKRKDRYTQLPQDFEKNKILLMKHITTWKQESEMYLSSNTTKCHWHSLFILIPFHILASFIVIKILKLYFPNFLAAGVLYGISFSSERHLRGIWKVEVSWEYFPIGMIDGKQNW